MSIDPRVTLVCEECGNPFVITTNWHRRKHAGDRPIICSLCEKIGKVEATEDGYWFWLEHYGATRNGLNAHQYVAAYGLPQGLADTITMIGDA